MVWKADRFAKNGYGLPICPKCINYCIDILFDCIFLGSIFFERIIMNLTDEFSEKMVNQFAGSEVNGLPYEDFVHEDYMYVLADLHDRGIEEAECWVWCDECDKEKKVINT